MPIVGVSDAIDQIEFGVTASSFMVARPVVGIRCDQQPAARSRRLRRLAREQLPCGKRVAVAPVVPSRDDQCRRVQRLDQCDRVRVWKCKQAIGNVMAENRSQRATERDARFPGG